MSRKKNQKRNLNYKERIKGNQVKNPLKAFSHSLANKSDLNNLKAPDLNETERLFNLLDKVDPQQKSNKKQKKLKKIVEMPDVCPRQIGFETFVSRKLPESRSFCRLNSIQEDVFSLVVNYIQTYYNYFDNNRDQLASTYHAKCVFSYSISFNKPKMFRFDFPYNATLQARSRNLKALEDDDDEQVSFERLLKGPVDVMTFVKSLPATEHDNTSFKFDCCYYTPHMMSYSITGLFREINGRTNTVRSFQRVFVCIPDAQTTMKIVNEQFMVSNVPREQYAKYFEKTGKS